eukprot:gene11147-12426_t
MGLSSSKVKVISAKELHAILQSTNRSHYQVIDVRDAREIKLAALPDASVINLPLSTMSQWQEDVLTGKLLDKEKPVICMCHRGFRSVRVANFLAEKAGFPDVSNVSGGINSYSSEADRSIPSYLF